MERKEDYKGLQIGKTYNIGWREGKHLATFEGSTEQDTEGLALFFKPLDSDTGGVFYPQSEVEAFTGCIGFYERRNITEEELALTYKLEEDENTKN